MTNPPDHDTPPVTTETRTIPIVEEVARIAKRVVEAKRVAIHNEVHTERVRISDQLRQENWTVEEVARDDLLDEAPVPTQTDDLLVFPVVEEVYVKRYHVTGEVRLRRTVENVPVEEEVELRRTHVTVDENDG